ncbi:aspartate ammonia-lyase [Lysinibacillus sp. NPDC047702]|uniref:aspartate ammonia-lyase n=1 Tax=unclassified Lysinibacillus TaxID=2636778 RepID=UPI003D00B013
MRIEKDFLGEMQISSDVYYGIQTMRSLENFPISGRSIENYPYLIKSMAYIKKAAALSNHHVEALDSHIKAAIVEATDEILVGKFENQFPVDIYQGGGGLSTNMNVNEVIANRANEIITGEKGYTCVHPNEHVNMSQSTNDVLPSAMKMACYLYMEDLIKHLEQLEKTLDSKVNELQSSIKLSRTCLQDALPMTFGQQFNAYLSFITRQKKELQKVQQDCLKLVIGATAIGTSLGAAKGYIEAMYQYLPKVSGMPVTKIEDYFDGLQHADSYIKISGCLKGLCSGLSKMAGDFRLLASGPRAGLAEITIPSVQPGSSIMPGKINPCIPEMMMQVCFDIYGMDQTITIAVDRGELELNIWESIIMKNLFDAFSLLIASIPIFNHKCVQGIQINEAINQMRAESSYSISVVISKLFGYEMANKVVTEAFKTDATIKEIVIKNGLLSKEDAEELLNPMNLVHVDV